MTKFLKENIKLELHHLNQKVHINLYNYQQAKKKVQEHL